jgi:valyl-tRNA synthetase
MIMAGLKFGPSFTGSTDLARNIPFRNVYFTSIVRDEQGRKMSKSLGNSPEPLDLIAEYGADAVRFTMLYLAPLGQDVLYSAQKNEIGRNFANKIWNAGRFLLMNKEQVGEVPAPAGSPGGPLQFHLDHLDLADRWILSRFHTTSREIMEGYDTFEINKVSRTIYDFFWHDYCDWYLEMIKSRLYGDEPAEVKQAVLSRALDLFDGALRLLHPLMPFVTEELWQALRPRQERESIMQAQIIKPDLWRIDPEAERQMSFVQHLIESLRNIRGEMSIPPSKEISLLIRTGTRHPEETIRKFEGYFARLARATSLSFLKEHERPKLAASAVVDGQEILVPLEGLIDIATERARLIREVARVSGLLEGISKKLENLNFLSRAPREVVENERAKQLNLEQSFGKLQRSLDSLHEP